MAGEVQLGEVAEIIMGQSPPGETYNEHGDGLPFFQGVADFNYRHPTPRVFCTAPARIAVPGDILLSVRAPIGRVNVADRRCAIGRGLSIIRPKTWGDGRYLEFALRMLETTWQAIEGSGSVFGNATRRDLETLRVPWRERECDRRAIAHILGTLDDKIELNRRMSQTLEAMARALFKAWFVDFDPVHAKMEGRWQRGQSLPGLPAHLYDLFPDRLVDSELGEIPEGWRVGRLGDLAQVTSGKRPNKVCPEPQPYASISLWGGNGPMGYVTEPLYSTPILLTGRVGTLGSVFRIATPCWPSDNTLVVIAREKIAIEFLYFQMKRFDYDALNRGSTQPLLTQTDLSGQQVPLPSNRLLSEFHKHVSTYFAKLDESMNESRTLAALRDALLPKLIRGEIRVKDAERFLETASR